MRKIDKIMLIGMLIIVPLGAYLDTKLVGLHGFWNYVFICLWEYALFWTGFSIAYNVRPKTLEKIQEQKEPSEDGVK